MHLSGFVGEEAVACDDVVVDLVPFCCGGELGTWVCGERVKIEAVDD